MAPSCEIRSSVKFSSFGEDDLINGKGIRSYIAKDASKLAAGFCTCIVHAIRLLCLCTTAATDPDLQDLLNIMVTDTMKNEHLWDVDEVMSRLKIELSTTTFQSLAQSFAGLIRQSTYLGELSWTGISSRTKLIKEVKVLYDSTDANKGKNMLFISFSQVPGNRVIELPYVFHIEKDSYKDGDIMDSTDHAVSFQTVGMVYSSLKGDKPNSYAFHFITYTRCFEDGQYQVYEHVPFPKGKVNGLHKVTHPLEEAKKGEELIPIKLQVLLQESGHSLVGLIKSLEKLQNLNHSSLPQHWMKDLFLAHCYMDLSLSEEAVNIYTVYCRKVFQNSIYIKSQIAKCFDNLRGKTIINKL